jgi:predicted O-methyltransferase YrrM
MMQPPDRVVPFLRRTAAREDRLLADLRAQIAREGLPSITPEAGRTLEVLGRLGRARRALEIGTCLGYSAIWIARGLPRNGLVETIDLDPGRSARAQEWVRRARTPARVKFHVGDAHEILPRLARARYDMVFIDADKEGMPDYLRQAKRLLRRGGLLAADNVFWGGSAFDEADASPGAAEVRAFVQAATSDPDLTATILPLGDGLLVAHRR